MNDDLQRDILLCLERIEQRIGQMADGPPSSVELKTSARGVDIAVKAYVGSPVREAGDAALGEYLRLREEHERRLMGQA